MPARDEDPVGEDAAEIGNPISSRLLSSAVPADGCRVATCFASTVHTATSIAALSLSHAPTTSGPDGARTPPVKSPAPYPPKVLNPCLRSITPSYAPVHMLQRTLPCAPPRSPPTATTRSPSPATDHHRATRPYGVLGVRGPRRPDRPG
ncbi:hypothetical protein ACFQV2_21660 [Actinokineospora soli]|uniref:Uncharacterized protein n=1 Tax=Actinokineospora soli TaxID=1048753 RepID=A0ABW2TPI1_9PSEU